jgi:hypothetical protein
LGLVDGAFFPGVLWLGHETDHPVPRLIMLAAVPPLPQFVFMVLCLINCRDISVITKNLKKVM